ncbi:hypothetical protein [Burkholderia sp. LMG 32019]|uniref:hypothetical protein n=1 Tax=Burkholderia sp. LMG 32019 TaxID=3158173 RepID=UPI003C30D3FC
MSIFEWLGGRAKKTPGYDIKSKRRALDEMFPFPHSFEAMVAVFNKPMDESAISALPAIQNLSKTNDLGLHALLVIRHMEVESFPRYLNLIKRNCEEVRLLHYRNGEFDTFVSFRDELGGRNAYVLTNSVELIAEQAKEEFSPPPPWIAWCHYGPYVRYSQGAEEYWAMCIWDPFWQNLSPDARDAYIEKRSAAALTYMSEEEWDEWVYSTRKNDPEYRQREGL